MGLILIAVIFAFIGAVVTLSVQSIFKAKPVTVVHCSPDITPEEREALQKQYKDAGLNAVVVNNVLETKTILGAK